MAYPPSFPDAMKHYIATKMAEDARRTDRALEAAICGLLYDRGRILPDEVIHEEAARDMPGHTIRYTFPDYHAR